MEVNPRVLIWFTSAFGVWIVPGPCMIGPLAVGDPFYFPMKYTDLEARLVCCGYRYCGPKSVS